MMDNNDKTARPEFGGFAVSCSPDGTVERILRDDFHAMAVTTIGSLFPMVVARESMHSALDMVAEAKTAGAAFDYELLIHTPDSTRPLHFAAAFENGHLIIVGESSKEKLFGVFEELSAAFNERLRDDREILRQAAVRDQEAFDEISTLNNELVDMQRELARKNAELRELHELKNRFLGMAAHDLRSPLSAIVLYTDFLLDHSSEGLSGQQMEYLTVVRDSGRFMVQLIESLLDVSVIESGSVNLDWQQTDLSALAARLATRMSPLASSRDIGIACESGGPIQFWFDPSKIEQILDNLLGNALKYCPSGSSVIIRTETIGREAIVEVVDNGPGIPQDEQARLFTFFGRGSTKSPHGEKAVGLGLAICKRIAEAHGGRIALDSEPGKGTTARLTLPLDVKLD
ncbi:MAG: HAMP domain-containing sensor histidine kinase [Spirochaetia bacterium]|jgi:signal transduction histidine kinase|nr:HAMP domain-containing sensor histidine kinase [Spirochaetia bacterium]